MTDGTIDRRRDNTVVKANALIQKARYSLTMRQQKILLFLISKINKTDAKETVYHTTIAEIADVCMISDHGGRDWEGIASDLLRMTERFEDVTIDGKKGSMSWLGDYYRDDRGMIDFWFNRNMADYLFELQEQYTKYKLKDILVFNCKYSIRLYEYIRSYAGQHRLEGDVEANDYSAPDIEYHTVTISVTEPEFRERIDCVDQYPKWKELNRSVIKKAVEEINANNIDIHVSYTARKRKGHDKVIIFTVISKGAGESMEQQHELNVEWVKAYNNINGRLGTGKHIGK